MICATDSAKGQLYEARLWTASVDLTLGKRVRSVSTNAWSARVDTISSGENPRLQARYSVTTSSAAVIAKFGHAFSTPLVRPRDIRRVRKRAEIRNRPLIAFRAAGPDHILEKMDVKIAECHHSGEPCAIGESQRDSRHHNGECEVVQTMMISENQLSGCAECRVRISGTIPNPSMSGNQVAALRIRTNQKVFHL